MTSSALSERNMNLEIIISEEYVRQDIDRMEALTANIANKTQISQIVDFLTKTISLKHFNHLKRIKSKDNCFEVIVGINDDNSKPLLEEIHEFLCQYNLLPLKTTIVPKNAPKNQIQYELSANLWPISYHPNKYIEKCLDSTLFDTNARKTIFEFMLKVIERRDKCIENKPMVTLVADSSHQILTVCESDVNCHPLKHSALVAIDSISKMQTFCDRDECEKNIRDESYLCNGCDFYMSAEPCIMCAMALVHSRIRRLFFLETNCGQNKSHNDCCDRAITIHRFHLLPKLNHHFESWKIFFN